MKKSLSLMLLLALSCSTLTFHVAATTYYVSPTGTGTGSISSPMSFTTAISKSLVGGDSLIFRGGTYSFSTKQSISKSGSAGNLLHFVAYQLEIPIFDFRTETYGSSYPGVSLSGNYVHFKGFIIQGAGDNGLYVSGSNNFIENCTTRWNCDSGTQMKTGSNNLILNCDSYGNFDYKTNGGNADGFADKQYTNTGTNTYRGCRSWSNSDDGWDNYEKIGNTVYDSCWCYNMAPKQYDMTNHIRYAIDKTYIDGFTNHIIPNGGNGNGFKMGGNANDLSIISVNNCSVHNCIAVGNLVKGFDQNNNNGTMILYNCTGYNNGNNYGFSNSSYGTLIIKNCASLSSKGGSNSFNCKSVTQSNNSWNTGLTCVTGDFVSLDDTQMLNGRQSDGSLPDITLLHLVSTSGMIDKGTDVGLPYNGSAPDLGAYEYSTITAVDPIHASDVNISMYYTSADKNITIRGLIASVEVYGLNGRKLFTQRVSTENMNIPATTFPNGICLVRVISVAGDVTIREILIN